jgi:hypothetical protein
MSTLGYTNCFAVAVLVGVSWSIARFDANRAVAEVSANAASAFQQDATRRVFTNFVAQWVFGPPVATQPWHSMELMSWISVATHSWVSVATQSWAAIGNR